ncbi:MAG: T9SS type A sorting domain-containing protein [Ginsengibacter sp.]
MNKLYIVLFLFFLNPHLINAQSSLNVSGKCINGTITLPSIDSVNGKIAYQGNGTVLGFPDITVSVYWLPAPDNLWVLDFDGQPYFASSCNSTLPPGSSNTPCPWTEVSGTTCTGSSLTITGNVALPVTFINFTAQNINGKALLSWKTSAEINNKGFEIQRSKDGINWSSIGFVEGKGNSSIENSYHFNDVTPFPANNFYRLVQYDFNGRFSISEVVNVEIPKGRYYSLGNNPGKGIYRLDIRSADDVKISVEDLMGRRIILKKLQRGVHQLDIRNHAPGTYLLRLSIGNQTFTEKLIKN